MINPKHGPPKGDYSYYKSLKSNKLISIDKNMNVITSLSHSCFSTIFIELQIGIQSIMVPRPLNRWKNVQPGGNFSPIKHSNV